MTMYADAVKTSGNEDNMTVKDIVDFVLEAMDLPEPIIEETASSDRMKKYQQNHNLKN
jgi:hypothetical protein